ncbi:hypothetical protein [Tolypothrix sp. FACHB-123]
MVLPENTLELSVGLIEAFYQALLSYQKRDRHFGQVKALLSA